MKANYQNVFEFLDLLLSKIESIEAKLSTNNQEYKYKEYMCIDELLEYLKKEKAIAVSKSKIYKLCGGAGGMPFRKVYGKLVFPRKEIDLWIDAQLNPERNQVLTGKVKTKINNSINIKKTNNGKL